MRPSFQTSPWTVSVEGAVAKPQKFDLDQLMKIAPLEERIYRHRCVEALVDRGAVDRIPAERPAQAGAAHRQSEIRRVPELLRSQADAARER